MFPENSSHQFFGRKGFYSDPARGGEYTCVWPYVDGDNKEGEGDEEQGLAACRSRQSKHFFTLCKKRFLCGTTSVIALLII
jgi:hypothetical protein